MDVVPLVLILHVYRLPRGNTERTARRPFIPRRTIGGFLAISVTDLMLIDTLGRDLSED
jgi:hypothetical protein